MNYTREELLGKPPRTAMVIISTVGLLVIALGTLLPIFYIRLGLDVMGWWKFVYAGERSVSSSANCFRPTRASTPA